MFVLCEGEFCVFMCVFALGQEGWVGVCIFFIICVCGYVCFAFVCVCEVCVYVRACVCVFALY